MADRVPPTLKVATTIYGRDNRFQEWNSTYGYYSRPDSLLQQFQTDNMNALRYNKEHLRASAGICATMRQNNKNQVVRLDKPLIKADPRPIVLTRSVSHEAFVNSVAKKREAEELGASGEHYMEAFMAIGAANNLGAEDQDDKYITMKDVPKVVNAVLGEDVPRFVIDKFTILAKKAEAGGRVYWADFRRLAPRAVAAASADCSLKKELPPLVMLMTKPRLVDPELGPMGSIKSTYSDTFCVSHADLISTYAGAKTRAVLNPAAKLLSQGTVKGTLQIPGFSGHMPRNTRNPIKVAHSDGQHLHPVVNSLRMTKKGGSNVLGYAGHIPWHAESEGESLGGCDPLTSTGAAYGPVRLML